MDSKVLSGIIQKQRKNSLLKELFRKSIHIGSALVPVVMYYNYWLVIALLIAAAIIYTVCEILILKGVYIPVVSKVIATAARKRDENKFVLGPMTMDLGVLITCLFLPWDCARVGIWALSFGDGFASLVGKMVGKITIPGAHGKTVAGSMACFLAVYVSTFCCSGNCLISLVIATIAMFIEVLPLADFDNLLIPISISSIYLLITQVLVH